MTRTLAAGALGAMVLGGSVAAEKTQFRQAVTVHGVRTGSPDIHQLTFSGPIALPGVTLAPGSYLFRRMGPHVLQVASARDRTPYAMVLTRAETRNGSLDRYEIAVGAPLADGAPPRLEAWFAAGESFGQQLIYPAR
jgi:hypothetical protein